LERILIVLAISSGAGISNAAAMLRIVVKVGCLFPLSSNEMKVLSKSQSNDRSCWLIPFFNREQKGVTSRKGSGL